MFARTTPVRTRANSKIGSAELSVMDHPLSISSARFKRNEDAAVKFLRFVFGKCIAGIRSWIGQKRPARSKKRMLEVFRFVDRSSRMNASKESHP